METPERKPPQPGTPQFGQPGYRNRPGRSGLDYIDTQVEFARQQGLFLRRLFTGRLYTRNPFYLLLMLVLGLLGLLAGLAVWQGFQVNLQTGLSMMIFLGFFLIVGIALLVNFTRSLLLMRSGAPAEPEPSEAPAPRKVRRAAALYRGARPNRRKR